MKRHQVFHLTGTAAALVLICGIASCSPEPDSSTSDSSGPIVRVADQEIRLSEITPERIEHDLVGNIIMIESIEGDSNPTEWTFDVDEPRQVKILERESTPAGSVFTIFTMTQNIAQPGEDAIMVSGKLRLNYQLRSEQWVLTGIENLTFRYAIGIAT